MKRVKINAVYIEILEKFWVPIVLLLLTATSIVSGYVAVFTALVFTFLVPGLIAHRFFSLKTHEILAFIPVFSVLVSVQFVYYVSLIFGYSREIIFFSFLALIAVYTLVVFKKGESFNFQKILKIKQIRKTSLLIFTVIFLISLAVLARSVWFGNQYGIVITGSNWQDTPLHYEIIESINNGNFPPQKANFAGYPENYHYFVDFHTAIVEKVYGYLPTLLPFLNAVFIVVFSLAIYALARNYGRKVGVIAVVLGVFGWGLSYFGLFGALLNGTFNPYVNYIYHFGETFQATQSNGVVLGFGLPSIFDNLLQQRPLLIGLPAFALVLALLWDMDDKKRIILAGVITGLTYEFHNVAFFCCYIAFIVCLLLNLRKFKINYLYFLVPTVFALPFILFGGSSFALQFSLDFLATYVKNPFIYYPLNLGIPFALAIISFIKRGHEYLKVTLLLLFLVPNILLLTPNPWDMYKFYMFAWVPIALLSGVVLAKMWIRKCRIVVLGLILLSIMTSASVVIFNVGTDYTAVNWSEYDAGLWVRDNTPQKSVFLTYYSIHAPSSMIGGQIRVSSYINWPYGHGVPLDQVFQREHDIDAAYNGTEAQLAAVVRDYNVSYVYVGGEELTNYPGCVTRFNGVGWLTQVYINGDLRIYQVDRLSLGG